MSHSRSPLARVLTLVAGGIFLVSSGGAGYVRSCPHHDASASGEAGGHHGPPATMAVGHHGGGDGAHGHGNAEGRSDGADPDSSGGSHEEGSTCECVGDCCLTPAGSTELPRALPPPLPVEYAPRPPAVSTAAPSGPTPHSLPWANAPPGSLRSS